jgi:hypothetical protein
MSNGLNPLKRNGRHEETRTPDLYRVKVTLNSVYNDFRQRGDTAKPL